MFLFCYFSTYSKQKRKRRRIKRGSDGSSSDDSDTKGNKGRRNIRKVIKEDDLEDDTKRAAREEFERKKRIEERQKMVSKKCHVVLKLLDF